MATGTSQVSLSTTAYVSLGTGPMLISPASKISIVASASQPAANVQGHTLVFVTVPFYFPLAQQVWAISLDQASTAAVTATS
jgi:hypothetical protein